MYHFIVNRYSGNGKGNRSWNKIKQYLIQKNVDFRVYFSERSQHASEILSQLKGGETVDQMVVAIGGDGTINEVVNGLIGSELTLGVVPAGSGNDFARSLQIPSDPLQALDRILVGKRKQIDLLQVNQRFCLTVVGIGFDGRVAELTNQSNIKKWFGYVKLGKLSYGMNVLRALKTYHPSKVTVRVDDEVTVYDDVWLVTVANVPYCGGGMQICPEASYFDGYFDICIVHSLSKFHLLRLFPKVYNGSHTSSPAVTTLRGKHVEVMSERPIVIHGDGETIGNTPVTVSIHSEALQVV
ncbi:diacylglycerol/lipid kinase family protein [Desertibacillus haloalkaliphilus]|uniref:diacylglycerol/lipid kinase family protein n=1 Tax=Desertibacillus haloalkaliphilus TaxID=1328930 RepID=UPI001C26ED20|nr:diacylglycerol kinase family protein [Desertibacillus haloalkaliphilus]MBU8906931.1 diacylglycerol kinase family lipid kinase [Desertibacillus haloalkaliphilus]